MIGDGFSLFSSLGSSANPWMLKAACRDAPDPDVFFPDHRGNGEEAAKFERVALDMCNRCPVKQECLDYAIRTKTVDGIFGGLTEKERKQYAANQSNHPRRN